MDPVRELKVRAELLHARLERGEVESLARLRVLPELRRAGDEELKAWAKDVQRKHCLAVVAGECGFSGWDHALRVFAGDEREHDLGTLMIDRQPGGSGVLHRWFAVYEEARTWFDAVAKTDRPYLLGYKRHFFLADHAHVERLGLERGDPDWAAIGWDWARPQDAAARGRLFFKRLAAPREA
jgi:hypothetical protein